MYNPKPAPVFASVTIGSTDRNLALGVSYRQVQAFLAQRGTTVDVSALHRFVHAKKRAHLLTQVQARLKQAAPLAAPSPSPVAQQVAQTGPRAHAPKSAAAKAPVAPPPPAPGFIPKFTWDPDQYNIEDLK